MNQRVAELLESYREEMEQTLIRWIRIPSVLGEAEEGAPFGRETRRMLDLAMEDAKRMGFTVRNFDGYACDVTLGNAGEKIAVLGHLDVVPAGDGWTRPPFEGVREGSRVYGRGTEDDKGPCIAALYAMRAIREAGIPLTKRSIRLILGCNEESDWTDMEYYAAHTEMPEMGFSPDALFPVINTEKGLLHLRLRFANPPSGLQVLEMRAGDRVNVIPGTCTALFAGGEELAEQVRAWGRRTGMPVTAQAEAGGVRVTTEGIPGHSAMPEGRRNAIGMMLCLMKELGAEGALRTVAEAVGLEYDGRSLGCACADEVSGPLTCNMGILRLENGEWTGTLDFRCPMTADLNRLKEEAGRHLPGVTVEMTEMKPAHHVPAEGELVTSLLAAYEEETGLEGRAFAIGGGTYAKVLKQGVAFGALFPDEQEMAHQADEHTDLNSMMKAARVFANALIRLAGDPS